MRIIPGVVIGIVKQVQAGEVKLEFPWLDQSYRTDWVAIAAPMAGPQRGVFLMPEPEDEVLVAFDHGDFDHPYVVGFLWNGVDTPPETAVKNRVILTPGGHTLRFEDADGAKKVILQSSSGHKIVLDDAAHTITVSDGGGHNQIVIDTQANQLKVQAATKVVVQAPQIELEEGATHPLVFGDQLLSYLNQLVALFNSHMHVGELALGIFPVTPIVPAATFPPATPALLSTQVKTN